MTVEQFGLLRPNYCPLLLRGAHVTKVSLAGCRRVRKWQRKSAPDGAISGKLVQSRRLVFELRNTTIFQNKELDNVTQATRPWTIWIVTLLLAFLALMAIPVGWMMMRAPHADLLGMPVAWIARTPFRSFLVPGIFLFGLLGLGSLCASYGLLARPGWVWPQRMNPFRTLRWEWAFATGLGVAFMIWITVQVLSLRMYFWLQPVVFVAGLAIVLIMLESQMRRYFAVSEAVTSSA